LLKAAKCAYLLVMGSRGRDSFVGLLGSVSRQYVHNAPCPVMAVQAASGSRALRPYFRPPTERTLQA
jgi:hypothetical protein